MENYFFKLFLKQRVKIYKNITDNFVKIGQKITKGSF